MSKEEIVILPSSPKVASGNFLFASTGEKLEQRAPIEKDNNNFKYIFEEAAKYSITPGTFKSRTLSNQIKELGDDFTWYIDEFSHNKSSVLRYGINAPKIDRFKLASKAVEKFHSDTSSSNSQSTAKIEERAKKVTHEKLEKFLIEKAIISLLESSEKKTVLVDIFARNDEGLFQLQENGVLETHTVVLYKNPLKDHKHQILVIDPSNFAYSSHIANLNGLLKHDLLAKIIVCHRSLQIYKAEKGNVGPTLDQYRDCIDIAVKLAFGLTASAKWLDINIDDIPSIDIIKAISNIPKIDKDIISDTIKQKDQQADTIRIKQTSDLKTLQAFYTLEQAINKSVAKLDASSFKELYDRVKSKYLSIPKSTASNSLTLQKLNTLYKECVEEHKRELDKELDNYQQLIGLNKEIEDIDS